MLGFSPFSAGPLSEASQSDAANAFLPTTLSSLASGTLGFDAEANITPSAATVTSVAGTISFVAKASVIPPSVSAQALPGGDFHSYGKANVTTAAATATSTVGTLDFDAKAFLTLTSSSGIFATPSVDFDAKANITTGSVTSSTAVSAIDFDAQAETVLAAAIASFALDIDFDAKANTTLAPAVADIKTDGVDFDAKANITPASVSAAFANSDLAPFGLATISLDSVQGSFVQNLGLPDAVKFDYAQFADKYSRYRTLVLLEEKQPELHFTVYIPQGETRTVFIEDSNRDGLNNTVFIPKENFTVFIDARQDRSNTVIITN